VLFAPAYFDANVYTRPGFSYSPSVVIDLSVFTNHLFVRSGYGHYYFGDYYATNYSNAGFFPWFSFHGRGGYDPIYVHQRWRHRQDRDWERRNETDFQHRRDHEDARPPHTWTAQKELIAREPTLAKEGRALVRRLEEVTNSPDSSRRFRPLANEERQNAVRRAQEVHKFRGERQRLESTARDTPTAAPAGKAGWARVKLPQSPIRGTSPEELDKDRAPPQRHVAPKPDLKIEPRPRKSVGKPESSKGSPKVTKPEPKSETPKPKAPPKDKPKAESKEKPKTEKKEKSKN